MSDIGWWVGGASFLVGFICYCWGYNDGRKDGIREQQGVQDFLDLGDVKSAIRRARREVGGFPNSYPATPPAPPVPPRK